jgi:hypothetical protein
MIPVVHVVTVATSTGHLSLSYRVTGTKSPVRLCFVSRTDLGRSGQPDGTVWREGISATTSGLKAVL